MANFARCLPLHGWSPQVLTIRDADVEQLDPQRSQTLAEVPVHRARVLPTVERMYARMRRRLAAGAVKTAAVTGDAQGAADSGETERLSRRIKRYILSFLVLPDGERGWIIPAAVAAVARVRRDDIRWIMTSCPPYSVHLIGLVVKALTGAKWVADFRDPWMTAERKQLYPTSAWSLKVDEWMERLVINRSDLLLFNVRRLRDAYASRYSHQPKSKFVFLPNGISTFDSAPLAAVSKYQTFTIAYAGSLYVGRSPEPVFKAFARLVETGKISRDQVRIRLIGHCRQVGDVSTAALVRQYGLGDVVEIEESLPHAAALDIVRRSHLALLLAPGLPYQIPAKIYDYLGAGMRILAIAEEGGTADLMAETGCGEAFAPDDIDGIAAFLHGEMMFPPAVDSQQASLARLDVRRITRRLVDHMDRLSSAGDATLRTAAATFGD